MMQYKEYVARVEFDDEAGVFHGEVMNTRDVVTFQGKSVAELRKAFHDSVDDYLAFCVERGEEPDKPFSGQFVARLPPELHRKVSLAAEVSGKSLNAWVFEQLQSSVACLNVPRLPPASSHASRVKAAAAKDERSQRDYTKWDVVIAGRRQERLSKRQSVFMIVKHLCDTGVTPEAISKVVSRTRLFCKVEGDVRSQQEFERRQQHEGRSFDRRRYFCRDFELIRQNHATYALTNQWGNSRNPAASFTTTISELLKAFPNMHIRCTESSEGDRLPAADLPVGELKKLDVAHHSPFRIRACLSTLSRMYTEVPLAAC